MGPWEEEQSFLRGLWTKGNHVKKGGAFIQRLFHTTCSKALYNDQFTPSGPEAYIGVRPKWQPLEISPCILVLILPSPEGWKAE